MTQETLIEILRPLLSRLSIRMSEDNMAKLAAGLADEINFSKARGKIKSAVMNPVTGRPEVL